ncbi:carboxypeptidase regulatory-like domain-containing protein [Crocinitomix sp.]|nr:carboxypeptidase regulatory-like domain-containing protein [Crocinitomix sp.]
MKTSYKYFLIFVLLILNVTAFGQYVTVSGSVIDEDENLLSNVSITIDGEDQTYYSNENGFFSIPVLPNDTYKFKFSYLRQKTKLSITVASFDIKELTIVITNNVLGEIVVSEMRTREFIDPFPPIEFSRISSITGNFEDIIKTGGLGVNSNNELTANYNVRGGNYDENLIYVNGIQIYRPFLARSGQQEGLSFINPAFVENVSFSGGGFDSYYGDKLSSVLDIQYRNPKSFGGSAQASFMGGSAHIEGTIGKRGNYITGARYRANSYLLNSLPTQGDYNPTFFDYQLLSNYYIGFDDKDNYQKLFVLGHFSTNNYQFQPQTRNTSWGTVNEAYQLRVFFEGQEQTKFQTFTAATGIETLRTRQNQGSLKLSFVSSVFHSIESEHFDILGEYWINELETDPSKEEFGDSTSNVGVGGFLDHARNNLNVWIGNVYHNGQFTFNSRTDSARTKLRTADLYWGAKVQFESFADELSEWHLIDSAGYSIPQGSSDIVEMKELIKQTNYVESYRTSGHLQFTRGLVKYKPKVLDLKRKIKGDSSKYFIYYKDTLDSSPAKLAFTIGTRAGYRTFNNESWITPRANITYTPRAYFITEDTIVKRRYVKFRLASGLYYQPPLYRTMRGIDGALNPDVVSQKSWHNVLGADVFFNLWGREFKFQSEAYYKYMWDVVPYEIDNVRIRYYGENSAVAYAYGFDAKINGQFVPGVESFFRIGYLKTEEDILNDFYYVYLNSDGDTIKPGYSFNNIPTDSIYQEPGFIPRPTDQRLTFSVFFQDRMPSNTSLKGLDNLKVSANLIMGTRLPYGPPTYERYKDVLRTKSYLRLDLGFMYDFVNPEKLADYKDRKVLKHFEQMTLSLDVFNLLGVNNIISYQWLQDIAGRYYAIPNHLTGRRINLRLIVKF